MAGDDRRKPRRLLRADALLVSVTALRESLAAMVDERQDVP